MTAEIIIKQSNSRKELEGILSLQKKNHEYSISMDEAVIEGFVYVNHDFPILKKMNDAFGHIIAVSNERVVGYALVMDTSFKHDVPSLIPMFDVFNACHYRGVKLTEGDYIVMGQICIAKNFRKMGIFRRLYQHMKSNLAPHFKYIITEIAIRNSRSLHAHMAIGFEEIHRYHDPEGEYWSIVLLTTN